MGANPKANEFMLHTDIRKQTNRNHIWFRSIDMLTLFIWELMFASRPYDAPCEWFPPIGAESPNILLTQFCHALINIWVSKQAYMVSTTKNWSKDVYGEFESMSTVWCFQTMDGFPSIIEGSLNIIFTFEHQVRLLRATSRSIHAQAVAIYNSRKSVGVPGSKLLLDCCGRSSHQTILKAPL